MGRIWDQMGVTVTARTAADCKQGRFAASAYGCRRRVGPGLERFPSATLGVNSVVCWPLGWSAGGAAVSCV